MRIKRIDLSGFKSFCDPASLDLRQPVSAVVGPNGCGKSNVVDALRWAMGEQSARHLRGKTMEDVIFNGSDSRGPSGMAEVSITFEVDPRSPVAVLDYSEVTITRRLHRDGSSEYLINKIPVRLRDITNLFLGTGVGTKAYSIIEQGRVGLIVSAKPEERRHFIEEAAGITKYQRRRQLAERKIEGTRQNLLRITDVLGELSGRLGSLRRQAQKAERYRQYKSEMRDIELWTASHQLLELTAEQKCVNAELVAVTQQREAAAFALERCELALEQERIAVVEQERALNQLQEQLYQLDNRIRLGESQIEFQSREAEELQRNAGHARGEVEELQRQLVDDEARLQETRGRAAALQQERAEHAGSLAGRQQGLDRLRGALGEVQAAIDGERQALTTAEREAARAEADQRAARQRRDDLTQRAAQGAQDLDQLRARGEQLRATAEELRAQLEELGGVCEQLEERRRSATTRLDELRQQVGRGEAELEVLRTELHRRRSRLASLQEIQARYEGLGKGTRAVMQRHNGSSRERGVLGVVADAIEAPAGFELAVEAVLGHRLGAVIVESDEVGIDAIRYLKESAQGRTSFISRAAERGESYRRALLTDAPIGFVWTSKPDDPGSEQPRCAEDHQAAAPPLLAPAALAYRAPGVHGPLLGLLSCQDQYRPVAEALLGDVIVVDRIETGVGIWDQVGRHTVVTLEGDILDPDGTVTGGSQDAENSGVLHQKREIKELKAIIGELQDQYDAALERHVSVKTEIATLEQVLRETTQQAHQSEKETLTREKDLGRAQSELSEVMVRHQRLSQELERAALGLAELDRQDRLLAETLVVACDRRWAAGDTLALLGREHRRLAILADDDAGSVTDFKVALAQVNATCAATEEALRQLERVRAERQRRVERLQQGMTTGLARAEGLKQGVVGARTEIDDLVGQRAQLQDSLSGGRTGYEARAQALGASESAVKTAREEAGSLGGSLGRLQLRGSELALRRRHLDEQIWERYREELPRVAGDYHLRPPVGEPERERIDQLRELIHRMGEINLTAIDEYNELSQRHDQLDRHRLDLEQALGQLQRAIQKINRTCRERFLETFNRVNEQFQQVFPRLFHGGKARLLLTEAEDVLQGGVEIVAQPPGKKLVSIDMMSGGEKALTATSLIFAMFLVKPTPFCLLDEVDAPLDDANVLRLRELVKELSTGSQFIIITHNHTTMEIADRLFGVTMEEPGVSKLVSVNLSEAQLVAA
ncbi:MAG: chromosome segregation protein SMC [Proteobacteria bacterium]|nr:chromosome segregation protein SMC [Pseudomonadota bacterium]